MELPHDFSNTIEEEKHHIDHQLDSLNHNIDHRLRIKDEEDMDDKSHSEYGFKRIQTFQSHRSNNRVSQYESTRTGLQIVTVERESPIVAEDFILATQPEDDSGAAHALEHIIFLGSKKYPYKGFLEQACNRANSYANAYTNEDHTWYTLGTAG